MLRLIEQNGAKVRCHLFEEIDRTQRQPHEGKKSAVAGRNSEQVPEPILSLEGLKKYYRVRGNHLKDIIGLGEKRFVKALERSSFEVPKGKTLGIVGESGCGKSTLLKTIIGLERPTAGEARFLGFDISNHISSRNHQLIHVIIN
jgi:peptide/nickel transport system ATP-binding protein